MPIKTLFLGFMLAGCGSFVWHSELDSAPAIAVPSSDSKVAWDDVSSSGDHFELSVGHDGAVCIDRSGHVTRNSTFKPEKFDLAMYVSAQSDRPTESTPHYEASRKDLVSWQCEDKGRSYHDNTALEMYNCQYKYAFCFDGAAKSLEAAQYATFVWGGVEVTAMGRRDIVRIKKS